ncbi:MAG: hypothetical protein IPM70_09155 [Proteobacteria bacterium]|nr:hypothetical protein [Pseudomonadota bacterium]
MDQGYVKREGGKITSRIQFSNGALTVNGKSPRVPPMFGGQPAQPPATLPEDPPPAE